MPVYPFKCHTCDNDFEEFFYINDVKKPTCPKCKGNDTLQCIAAPSDWHPHPCTFNGKFPLTPGEKEEKWKNVSKSRKYY